MRVSVRCKCSLPAIVRFALAFAILLMPRGAASEACSWEPAEAERNIVHAHFEYELLDDTIVTDSVLGAIVDVTRNYVSVAVPAGLVDEIRVSESQVAVEFDGDVTLPATPELDGPAGLKLLRVEPPDGQAFNDDLGVPLVAGGLPTLGQTVFYWTAEGARRSGRVSGSDAMPVVTGAGDAIGSLVAEPSGRIVGMLLQSEVGDPRIQSLTNVVSTLNNVFFTPTNRLAAETRLRSEPIELVPADAAEFSSAATQMLATNSFSRSERGVLAIVQDRSTCLEWLVWNDRELSPACDASSPGMKGVQARECVEILAEFGVAGRTDWRLPTLDELATITKPRIRAIPGESRGVFVDELFGDNIGWFWSADGYAAADGAEHQWAMCVGDNVLGRCPGPLDNLPNFHEGSLLAVRSERRAPVLTGEPLKDIRLRSSVALVLNTRPRGFSAKGSGLIVAISEPKANGDIEVSILTAAHVLDDATKLQVAFFPDTVTRLDATIRAQHPDMDLALLSVALDPQRSRVPEAPEIRVNEPGTSGEPVALVGNSVQSGFWRVSRGNTLDSRVAGREWLLRLDMQKEQGDVYPGDSGGGVFNRHGHLIGIVSEGNTYAEPIRATVAASWLETFPELHEGRRIVDPGAQLAEAARIGALGLVRDLLSATSVEERSFALLFAATSGNQDIVKELLQAGAVLSAADSDGRTALHNAAAAGRTKLITFLIDAGAGGDTMDRERGDTPLHLAARLQKYDAVHALLDAGVAVDVTNKKNSTPLIELAGRGEMTQEKMAAAKRLIAAGADINSETTYGVTPLLAAALAEENNGPQLDLVRLFIREGARVDPVYEPPPENEIRWRYPLVRVLALDGTEETLREVLKAGAPVDARDDDGMTALMLLADETDAGGGPDLYCLKGEDWATVHARVLIEFGTDLALTDHDGRTALTIARERWTGTPGDERCKACMIAALRGGRCNFD